MLPLSGHMVKNPGKSFRDPFGRRGFAMWMASRRAASYPSRMADWNISEIRTTPSLELFSSLVELLQDAVASGASVGFLAPLATKEARNYWIGALEEVGQGERVILVASANHDVVGCVQLLLSSTANARHRGQVQKLIVLQRARRHGLGRALLVAIEKMAVTKGRSLLVADTPTGGAGEQLYAAAGYTRVGAIPRYLRGPDGHFHPTTVFYRELEVRATQM
jgi:acetyltransferase